MSQARVVFVGGFLGAGKTTLLTKAAGRLAQQGKVVGVVTNDQAADLVDTGSLREAGFAVQEVAGGCFCCRFDQLLSECDRLVRELRPDVVLTEPVGSCTDVSATVLNPLKQMHAEEFRVAPLSVLVDPQRMREALDLNGQANFPDSVYYIFRKQLEEADLIVLNKVDTLTENELAELKARVAAQYPDTPVLAISALRGDGVGAWLDAVMQDAPAGKRIAEVDYDTYAEGEAVLGWLNAMVSLRAAQDTDWGEFCVSLLRHIQQGCRAVGGEIAHAKLFLTTSAGKLVSNLTSNIGEPYLQGEVKGSPREALLTVNARVRTDPAQLRAIVERSIRAAAGENVSARVTSISNFSPARPQPTHRYAAPV